MFLHRRCRLGLIGLSGLHDDCLRCLISPGFRMAGLGIGQRCAIEIPRPCSDDCTVPRKGLEKPERILRQFLCKKQFDVAEKNHL